MVNQKLVYPQPYTELNVSHGTQENYKIITIRIPNTNNKDLIIGFLREYTSPEKVYCIYVCNERLIKVSVMYT